jgi:hemoglobin
MPTPGGAGMPMPTPMPMPMPTPTPAPAVPGGDALPAPRPAMPSPSKASLYDRLGGAKAIEAVTDEFLKVLTSDARIVANPDVAKRAGAIDLGTLRRHVIDFISMAAGGNVAYHGRDMRSAHAGLNITEAEWAAGVDDLVKVLDQFKVPAAEKGELLGAVASIKGDVVTGKTLYERLGGLKAIEAVTDDFLARLTKNEVVMGNEAVKKRLGAADMDALRMHVIFFIAKATGGPVTYTGRDMKSSHTGLAITHAEWVAAAGELVATLDAFKVPEAEKSELLGAVSALEADIVQAPAASAETPAAK